MMDIEGFLLALEALTREYKIEIAQCKDEVALYPLCSCESGPDHGYSTQSGYWHNGAEAYFGLEWGKKK